MDTASTPAQLVRELGGIQAQDILAAKLALRPRGSRLTIADVERALTEERSFVRTWGPRGTLHLLATEDLGWLLPLMGPVSVAATRRRRAELRLDEERCTRGITALRELLAGQGPLIKAEIVEQLESRGIHTEGQATIHLLMRAALEGVLCLGPERGAKATYVLLDDWASLGPSLMLEEAYAKLAYRYLEAYGPATPEDMATWSGLPMSPIRAAWRAIANQLLEVQTANKPAFAISLLGYKKRELILPPHYAKHINAGGGMLKPVLLAEGRVLGIWKSMRKKDQLEITVEPFEQLTPQVRSEYNVMFIYSIL